MLIDTHCHLTTEELAPHVEAVLERARQAGVERVITVAVTPADTRAALELVAAHPEIDLAAGIHPHEAAKCTRDDLDAIAGLHRGQWRLDRREQRLVAVGETGLDFHYDFAPPKRQEEVFRFQLELACEVGRPVVIHARKAERRVCDILADFPRLEGRVVFHCYSGDEDSARRILDMGLWLSFTGLVTFKNAETARAAARLVPAERLMVESDAPYLSPVPVRNVRPNQPGFVRHTARRLADVRGETFEDFAAATTANAIRFFQLSGDCS